MIGHHRFMALSPQGADCRSISVTEKEQRPKMLIVSDQYALESDPVARLRSM